MESEKVKVTTPVATAASHEHSETIQRKCAECEEEEKTAQRKEMGGSETSNGGSIEGYVDGLSGSGESLPEDVKNFYEPRFGYDFSDVKIHKDSEAAQSAQSINALAYTTGNNIVFNENQFSPGSEEGKRLLGHELTHVVQQNDNLQTKRIQRLSDPDCDTASGLPMASTCAKFQNTCYSNSFTAPAGTVKVSVDVSYFDDTDCSFPTGQEDFRVIVYQCGWYNSEVLDLGTASIGSSLSGSVTLPGSGWFQGTDRYFVKVRSRSNCKLHASISVS